MAMRLSNTPARTLSLVLALCCTLLALPAAARDGRIMLGSKPLGQTFRSKKGIHYLPVAEVCAAFGLKTTLVTKENLLTVESPLAGTAHLLLATAEFQAGGKVTPISPAPIQRDGIWFLAAPFMERHLGITGATGSGPDVYLAAMAKVAPGPQGLQFIASVPLTPKGFYLDNPPRYVLDLPNCVLDRKYTEPFASTENGYSAIRVGQFSAAPFTARIVYDLTSNSYRPEAAKTKGMSRLRLGGAQSGTLFPSYKVTIGMAPDGSAVVIDGLLAAGASLTPLADGGIEIVFRKAHLAGPSTDYKHKAGMTDTGIKSINITNDGDEEVRVRIHGAKAAPNATVSYDAATSRATIRLQPTIELLPKNPPAGSSKGTGLKGKVILIDPGHGGYDPGAIKLDGIEHKSDLVEKTINLRMSLDLAERLRRAGATVVLTRSEDAFVELNTRKNLIDKHSADFFVSLHCNSFRKVSSVLAGTEVYYYKGADSRVADLMYRHVSGKTGRGGRGALQANFVVCKHPTVPSVLVESAYLSNPDEYALFADPDRTFEKSVVGGVAEGITAYFNGDRSLPSTDPEVFTEVIMDAQAAFGDLTHFTVLDLPGAPLNGGIHEVIPTAPTSPRETQPNRGDIFRPESSSAKEPASPQAERRRRIFRLDE